MRLRTVIGALACGVITFVLAAPAAAQGVKVDFAGGYQFFRFLENGGANIPAGWGASVAFGKDSVKAVVDADGSYKNGGSFHTLQGGVEFSGKDARVVPFGRVLTGVALLSDGYDTQSVYVVTPEAGVKVMTSNHVGVQTSVGFPLMFKGGDHAEGFRFFAGVVIRR